MPWRRQRREFLVGKSLVVFKPMADGFRVGRHLASEYYVRLPADNDTVVDRIDATAFRVQLIQLLDNKKVKQLSPA